MTATAMGMLRAMDHMLPDVPGSKVVGLQPGGGRGASETGAFWTCPPRPLAVGRLGARATSHTLPATCGGAVARPQPGGGCQAPALGPSGACPPCTLAARGSSGGGSNYSTKVITTLSTDLPMEVPAEAEVAVHAQAWRGICPLLGGAIAAHGLPWEVGLKPHLLASTARSGLVLAVESPLSPLRQSAVAGVGWARPAAVLRLGGARTLVPCRADASPASS
jgi:hypothetical protein